MKIGDLFVSIIIFRFLIAYWEGRCGRYDFRYVGYPELSSGLSLFVEEKPKKRSLDELKELLLPQEAYEEDDLSEEDMIEYDIDDNYSMSNVFYDEEYEGHTIFYHVFLQRRMGKYASSVVLEQIRQIGNSFAAKQATQQNRSLSVHINVIGPVPDATEARLRSRCHRYNLKCHKNYYNQGDEPLTLTEILQYCQVNLQHSVTYLHSKGTFHKREFQAKWRRALTLAALEETCIHPPDASCNACGLIWEPFWTLFVPGNMWTVKCSYLSKLIPVRELETKISNITEIGLEMGMRTFLYSDQQIELEKGSIYGLGRFASEHWIGTHPDIIPCDQASYHGIPNVFIHPPDGFNATFSFSMAPRHALDTKNNIQWTGLFGLHDNLFRRTMESDTLRLKEYVFLAGLVWKWHFLYGKVPSDDSWFWRYYPDGEVWKAAVKLYGAYGAVEKVIEQPLNNETIRDFKASLLDGQTNITKS